MSSDPPQADRRKDEWGCPYCGESESRVVDTKPPKRRRECKVCRRRYNTREVVDDAA